MEDKITLSMDIGDRAGIHLGIIIKKIDVDQYHLGFIFIQGTEPCLAHFGWKDCFIYERNKTNGYAMHWLDFMDPENALPVITLLQAIGRNLHFKAGYGITNVGNTTFNQQDGHLIKNADIDGDSLTCAVFVLCVLEQFDFHLVDRESWQITQQSIDWQKKILKLLKTVLQPEFYRIQEKNIGKYPRFSPDQVMGASCIYDFEPVHYMPACAAAKIVVEKLDKLYSAI